MNNQPYSGVISLHRKNEFKKLYYSQEFNCYRCTNLEILVSENSIIEYESPDSVILLDGQIYNFNNIPFKDSDYTLIAASLHKEPDRVMMQLDGEFTLINISKSRDQILIANSISGTSALYYYSANESTLLFSNSTRSLQSLSRSKFDLNVNHLLDFFLGNNLGGEQTFNLKVKRLLPGQMIIIDETGFIIKEYSNISNHAKRYRRGDKAIQTDIYSVIHDSVNKRINKSNVGISLSAGLDSTTIAAVVSKSIDPKLKALTYTYKPKYLSEGSKHKVAYDESLLLDEFLKRYSNLYSKKIIVNDSFIIKSFERSLEIFNEPIFGSSNLLWLIKMFEMVKEDKCDVLLDAQGGNFSISWPPPEVMHHVGIKSGIKRILKFKSRINLLPYVNLEGDNYYNNKNKIILSNYQLHRMQPNLLRNLISYSGVLHKQVALAYGISYTDPTVDKHLVEFCLSLPFSSYHDKKTSRKIVRIGMKDHLPNAILNNYIRGIQSSDIKLRMDLEKEELYNLLLLVNKNKLVNFVFNLSDLIRDWKYFEFTRMKRQEINHILRIILVSMFIFRNEN